MQDGEGYGADRFASAPLWATRIDPDGLPLRCATPLRSAAATTIQRSHSHTLPFRLATLNNRRAIHGPHSLHSLRFPLVQLNAVSQTAAAGDKQPATATPVAQNGRFSRRPHLLCSSRSALCLDVRTSRSTSKRPPRARINQRHTASDPRAAHTATRTTRTTSVRKERHCWHIAASTSAARYSAVECCCSSSCDSYSQL